MSVEIKKLTDGLRNECRNCRRPIYHMTGVGWLHDELPQYAHEQITCENALPVRDRP